MTTKATTRTKRNKAPAKAKAKKKKTIFRLHGKSLKQLRHFTKWKSSHERVKRSQERGRRKIPRSNVRSRMSVIFSGK